MPDTEPQIDRLCNIMKRLRDPETGCAWDIKQNFDTIAPYTIEEAYEVADAIQQQNPEKLCDELGDLLLQVVFHAQIATVQRLFGFDDIARTVSDKMIRRHPHIFSDVTADTEEAIRKNWEQIKAEERAASATAQQAPISLMDDIPKNMPASKVAVKMQKRAASVGFDWPDISDVLEKLKEETAELEAELAHMSKPALKEEIGDLLFVIANLARKAGIDPETALMGCNHKFDQRFRHIENRLRQQGKQIENTSLSEMDALWNEAKSPKE